MLKKAECVGGREEQERRQTETEKRKVEIRQGRWDEERILMAKKWV